MADQPEASDQPEEITEDRKLPYGWEDAYAEWKKTSPFGDNVLIKTGFEAGWHAVFKAMCPEN